MPRIQSLHRWVGMTVGAVIAMFAITGAMMMFRPQIEPRLNLDLVSVPACRGQASLDAMTATAKQANPKGMVDFIRIEQERLGSDRHLATWIRFMDKDTYFFDPCTGKLLGSNNRYKGFFGTFENLHRMRFVEGGNKVTGSFVALFLLIGIPSGVFVWARLRHARKARAMPIKMPTKGAPLRLWRHRTIGILVAPIIAAQALTGLPHSFGWYKDAILSLGDVSHDAEVPKSRPIEGGKVLTLDQLREKILAIDPDPAQFQFRYPTSPDDGIEAFYIPRNAPHSNARNMLYLDAYSGKVLSHVRYEDSGLGNKIYWSMITWHNGKTFGLFTQLMILAGCLGLIVVVWTGMRNVLRRKFSSPPPSSSAPTP